MKNGHYPPRADSDLPVDMARTGTDERVNKDANPDRNELHTDRDSDR